MRRFKFRVWSQTDKRWINSCTIGANDGIPCVHVVAVHENNSVEHLIYSLKLHDPIIHQFTGLKDKNGIDIYEGDFIKRYASDWRSINVTPPNPETIFQVKYIDNQTKFNIFDFDLGYYHKFEYEVIGNVFENPELLK